MKFLLVGNGNSLSKAKMRALKKGRKLIVLDGGLALAHKYGLKPDFIIGDMDSAPAKLLTLYARKKTCCIITLVDQNTTDLEKGILHAILQGASDIVIVAVHGERTDHSLGAFSVLKKFHHPEVKLTIHTEKEIIFYVQNCVFSVAKNAGNFLAIFPFSTARVLSKGLKYELKNTTLEWGKNESVANEIIGAKAKLKISGAALVIQRS